MIYLQAASVKTVIYQQERPAKNNSDIFDDQKYNIKQFLILFRIFLIHSKKNCECYFVV